MKKKLISVILASALTVGLLSACGSDSSKDNDANSKIDTTETGSNTTKSDTSSAPVSVTLNEVAHSIFYAPMYVASLFELQNSLVLLTMAFIYTFGVLFYFTRLRHQ